MTDMGDIDEGAVNVGRDRPSNSIYQCDIY